MRSWVKTGSPISGVTRIALVLFLSFHLLLTKHVSANGGDNTPLSTSTKDEHDLSTELDLYYDVAPMVWMSRLVYSFSALLKEARSGKLDVPDHWKEEYKDERFDVRKFSDNHGLPFSEIGTYIEKNQKELAKLTGYFAEFDLSLIKDLRAVEDMDPTSTTLFLETFDAINHKVECVYGIMKDEERKRIVISFRGSKPPLTNKDWNRNFQAFMAEMRTPKLLKPKLEERLQENILVHEGFYEYLFNNSQSDGEQKYDRILDDIKPFLAEPGYKIYVTGHSLGAALGSLLAFKLAGSAKEWIPKPITCITFESPFVGGADFLSAFKVLEKEGLVRYLRVTNSEDLIPSIPPWSLGWPWQKKAFKHVGIHLNLKRNSKHFAYPRANNNLGRALGNSFLTKSFLKVLKYHDLSLVDERLEMHKEALQNLTLRGLYQNEDIVGDSFFSRPEDDEL